MRSAEADPQACATAVGLRYITEGAPGIYRKRNGKGFIYVDSRGRTLRNSATLRRIRALAIPPAWTEVWICPSANGHLQATGRDARGRKQHLYHPDWRQVRDASKFDRMLEFGRALPLIRRQTSKDLARHGLPRGKVLAAVVKLLEMSLIRVGNSEYAKANGSFGLTTLQDRHVSIAGSELRFEFRGKGGKHHAVNVRDRRLARIVQQCQDIPGQELFQYLDSEGRRQKIGSADVNRYLREITGKDFTAKDFRTWAGSVLASFILKNLGPHQSQREAKKNIQRAIQTVARCLGNTPAICRKSYIHPVIPESYLEGYLTRGRNGGRPRPKDPLVILRVEERHVLKLLRMPARKRAFVPAAEPAQ